MAGEGKNRFGPNAWATDYPPVLLVGDLPEHLDVLRWRENVYLVGQSHSPPARLGHGLSALHLDGAGVFGGRFCTSPSDLPDDEMTREDSSVASAERPVVPWRCTQQTPAPASSSSCRIR